MKPPLLVLFCWCLLLVPTTTAFFNRHKSKAGAPTSRGFRKVSSSSSMFPQSTRRHSSLGSDFNPLQKSNTVVSLRKTKMQDITNALLHAVSSDPSKVTAILTKHKSFLLEPLEDPNAVLDSDSIYLNCSTRHERFRAFESSMQRRLESAHSPAVVRVLEAMRDFVLSFE